MDRSISHGSAASRIVPNLFNRFRRVAPWRLAGDVLRAARLRRRDPPPRAFVPRPERLVVGMTTVPERVGGIRPALRSLLDQSCPADRLLLAWPSRALRTGAAYPEVPALPAGVEVVRCEDEGPVTKLLPLLRAEAGSTIVVADDDVIYPFDFLETLLRAHRKNPQVAVGLRGWKFRPGVDPRHLSHVFGTGIATAVDVDVLFGTWGYLLPPNALDRAVFDFDGWPPEVRWVDDIWISGHLAKRKVPRCVVPSRGYPIETAASNVAALTFGPNRSGHNDRVAIEAFSAWW